MTISGGSLEAPIRVNTNGFGYFSIEDVPAGETYIISVGAKGYRFVNPTQVLNLADSVTDVSFVAQ